MTSFTLISIFTAIADQFIKHLVRMSVTKWNTLDTFLPFLKITYIKNDGAAFGSMAGMRIYLIVFSALVIASVIYYIFKKSVRNKCFLIPTALALGGAMSNLYDRIVYGFVTDYIKLTFFPPVCNLADYCICFGTAFLLIVYFKKEKIT